MNETAGDEYESEFVRLEVVAVVDETISEWSVSQTLGNALLAFIALCLFVGIAFAIYGMKILKGRAKVYAASHGLRLERKDTLCDSDISTVQVIVDENSIFQPAGFQLHSFQRLAKLARSVAEITQKQWDALEKLLRANDSPDENVTAALFVALAALNAAKTPLPPTKSKWNVCQEKFQNLLDAVKRNAVPGSISKMQGVSIAAVNTLRWEAFQQALLVDTDELARASKACASLLWWGSCCCHLSFAVYAALQRRKLRSAIIDTLTPKAVANVRKKKHMGREEKQCLWFLFKILSRGAGSRYDEYREVVSTHLPEEQRSWKTRVVAWKHPLALKQNLLDFKVKWLPESDVGSFDAWVSANNFSNQNSKSRAVVLLAKWCLNILDLRRITCTRICQEPLLRDIKSHLDCDDPVLLQRQLKTLLKTEESCKFPSIPRLINTASIDTFPSSGGLRKRVSFTDLPQNAAQASAEMMAAATIIQKCRRKTLKKRKQEKEAATTARENRRIEKDRDENKISASDEETSKASFEAAEKTKAAIKIQRHHRKKQQQQKKKKRKEKTIFSTNSPKEDAPASPEWHMLDYESAKETPKVPLEDAENAKAVTESQRQHREKKETQKSKEKNIHADAKTKASLEDAEKAKAARKIQRQHRKKKERRKSKEKKVHADAKAKASLEDAEKAKAARKMQGQHREKKKNMSPAKRPKDDAPVSPEWHILDHPESSDDDADDHLALPNRRSGGGNAVSRSPKQSKLKRTRKHRGGLVTSK